MIVLGLRAKNFMRFRDFAATDLPSSGLIGIFGDNETGKSAIGELICHCLFGKTTRATEGEPARILKWGAASCETELEFILDRRRYRVTRRLFSDGKREARLISEPSGEPLADGAEAVNDAVSSLLGYGFMEFRYSTYIAQKELDLIIAGADDRKQALGRMLGIEFMDGMAGKMALKAERLEQEKGYEENRLKEKKKALDELMRDQDAYRRLSDRLGEMNDDLLVRIRERNAFQSELEWLTEAREKKEIQEILEIKIQRHREKLHRIDAELKRISEEFDSIPNLLDRAREKKKEIEDIQARRIPDEEARIAALEARARLADRLRLREGRVQEREKDLTAILDRIATARKKADLGEAYRKEIEETRSFLRSLNDLGRFEQTTRRTHDLALQAKGELSRIQGKLREENETILEAESALQRERELIAKQIEKAALTGVDQELVVRLQHDENKLSLLRNLSGLGSFALFVLAMVTASLFNLVKIAFGLGAGGFALSLLGVFYNYRGKAARNALQNKQQQLYAFNVSQRSREDLMERQEDLDDAIARETAAREAIKKRLSVLDRLHFGFRSECADSLMDMKLIEDAALADLAGLTEDLVGACAEIAPLFGDDFSLDSLRDARPSKAIGDKKKRLDELELTADALCSEANELDRIVDEKNRIESDLQAMRKDVDGLKAEIDAFKVEEPDAAVILNRIESLRGGVFDCETEVSRLNSNVDRIRKQESLREDLLAERGGLVADLDRDTIRFYDCKEATKDGDLSDSRLRELRESLNRAAADVQDRKSRMSSLTGEMKAMDAHLKRGETLREEARDLERGILTLEDQINKRRELKNLFHGAGRNIKKRLTPMIESYFSWALPKLTRGRYQKVRMDEEFNIEVYSPEKGGFVPLDRLSGGAADQLLIALRLAFSRAVTSNSPFPRQFLFLDEPFSSFDESRRELFLSFLRTMKNEFQQIFLISHLSHLEEHVDAFMRLDLAGSMQPKSASWAFRPENEEARPNLKLVR